MAGFDREMKTELDFNEVGGDREVTMEVRGEIDKSLMPYSQKEQTLRGEYCPNRFVKDSFFKERSNRASPHGLQRRWPARIPVAVTEAKHYIF